MGFQRVCVYAGSAPGAQPAYVRAASDLAAALVRRGSGVVYGGGSLGLMGALAEGTLAADGEIVGVIPRFLDDREIGHGGLSELHVTENMHDRKMLMAELSDAFVVLPGGIGTLEEVVEMLSWSQLGLHRKPIGLLDTDGFWAPLVDLLDHMTTEQFVGVDHRRLLVSDPDPESLLDAMDAWEAPAIGRQWLKRSEET
jgi:uncharacterized protein (TIGR00730 family)